MASAPCFPSLNCFEHSKHKLAPFGPLVVTVFCARLLPLSPSPAMPSHVNGPAANKIVCKLENFLLLLTKYFCLTCFKLPFHPFIRFSEVWKICTGWDNGVGLQRQLLSGCQEDERQGRNIKWTAGRGIFRVSKGFEPSPPAELDLPRYVTGGLQRPYAPNSSAPGVDANA